MPIRIGLLVFPNMTQLDMTGPLQVFSSLPDAEVHLLWKTCDPVLTDGVLRVPPTTALADCPRLDVICVPGGYGVIDLLDDQEVLSFLRHQAAEARFIGSICTGSLVLGAAGLLRGRKATTHWSWIDLLPPFGAIPTPGRVVQDGNILTGGGVTAGIDFGLTMVAALAGQDMAERIQLRIEYTPAPPFQAGSPETARPELVADVRARMSELRAAREARVAAAAERMPA